MIGRGILWTTVNWDAVMASSISLVWSRMIMEESPSQGFFTLGCPMENWLMWRSLTKSQQASEHVHIFFSLFFTMGGHDFKCKIPTLTSNLGLEIFPIYVFSLNFNFITTMTYTAAFYSFKTYLASVSSVYCHNRNVTTRGTSPRWGVDLATEW